MRGVVGQVQEKGRAARFSADERGRSVGQGIGQIAGEPGRTPVLPERQQLVGRAKIRDVDAVVVMSAGEKAEEGVEAAVERMKRRRGAEMPFADQAGTVAGVPQVSRKGRCFQRQSVGVVEGRVGEAGDHAETVRIAPRHQADTRGTAQRGGRVAVGEDDALPRQPVDVRGRDLDRAVEAHVVVAKVVDMDEDDVRLVRRTTSACRREQADAQQQDEQRAPDLRLHVSACTVGPPARWARPAAAPASGVADSHVRSVAALPDAIRSAGRRVPSIVVERIAHRDSA